MSPSNFPILYAVYGYLAPFFAWQTLPYYIVFLLPLALLLGAGIEALLYSGFGAALGSLAVYALHIPRALVPEEVRAHRHTFFWFFLELALASIAFLLVDLHVPETGFAYGVFITIVLFLLWWGLFFFSNFIRLGEHGVELQSRQLTLSGTYITFLLFGETMLLFAAIPGIKPLLALPLSGAAFVIELLLMARFVRSEKNLFPKGQ